VKAGTLNSSARVGPAMKLVDKSAAKRNKSEQVRCIRVGFTFGAGIVNRN